jgi:hypothetical protein
VWAKDKNDLIANLKTAPAETPKEKINDIQNNQEKAESLTLAEIELGKKK